MKIWQVIKEWGSVGTGACLGGALAVVVANAAVVRVTGRGHEPTPFPETAQEPATQNPTQDAAGTTRTRLSLPSGQTASTAGNVRHARLVVKPRTGNHAVATRIEPLSRQPAPGKVDTSDPLVAGVLARLEAEKALHGDKAQLALPTVGLGQVAAKDQKDGEIGTPTAINPHVSGESGMVNAGFGVPDQRTPGEELSFAVNDAFQSSKGPLPMIYVDEDTGALMFGLGWQH